MKISHVLTRSLLAAAALSLIACAPPPTEAESIARARQALASRNLNGAYVELQNALQQNAYSSEARFLLAQLLLEKDQPILAVVELKKASDQGHPEAEVLPLMAKALLRQNKVKDVVTQFSAKNLSVPAADADLKTSLAIALFNTGKKEQAQAVVQTVLNGLPEFAPAVLFKAQMAADTGQVDVALTQVADLLKAKPGEADAWRVQGDLQLYGKFNAEGAIQSYAKALDLKASDPLANKAIIVLHLARGELPLAERRLAAMKVALPNDPQARYFDAQMAYQRDELGKARDLLEPLLKASPDNPWVLVLAGAVELSRKSLSQAEAHLLRVIRLYPGLQNARVLMARVNLRQGDAHRAIATLEPMLATSSGIPFSALTTAAEAYLLAGDPNRAGALFDLASRQAPNATGIQIGKAQAMLAKGQTDAALAEFVRLSSADAGSSADMALINVHLGRNQMPEANAAIDALIKKRPDDTLGYKLRAEVAMRQGAVELARTSFEKCLALDPNYFAAVAGLAALDMGQGRADQARKRFEALIVRQPKLLSAKLALASLLRVSGASKADVVSQLSLAAKEHADDARAHLELVGYLLQIGDNPQALSAATRADRAIADNTELMLSMARAQEATGDFQQAMATYGKITAVRPQVLAAQLGIAELQLRRKDLAGATSTFTKARQLQPNSPEAVQGLARVEVAAGRYDAAIALARDLSARKPTSPLGLMLEADVELARSRPDAAATAFVAALKRPQASGSLAAYAHAALWRAGRIERAESMAEDWLKTRPDDVAFLSATGSVAQQAGNKALAEKRFREALRLSPDHVRTLNNLAWLLAIEHRKGAVEMAERAHKLQPTSPDVLDTLARALESEGQWLRAAQVQRQAIERKGVPVSEYNLSLARILLAQGQKADALAELNKLSALGENFAGAPEVARLQRAAAN